MREIRGTRAHSRESKSRDKLLGMLTVFYRDTTESSYCFLFDLILIVEGLNRAYGYEHVNAAITEN